MTTFNMIDSPPGPDPKRLLLAVVITSAVLMLYSYFFAKPETLPLAKVKDTAQESPPVQPEMVQPQPHLLAHEEATVNIPAVKSTFANVAKTQADIAARTSYQAEISNIGAIIDRYVLTDFNEDRVLFDQAKFSSSLLKLSSHNKTAELKEDAAYEIKSFDESQITLKHVTKEGLAVERNYRFKDHAVINETVRFKNLSDTAIKIEASLVANKEDEHKEESSFLSPGASGQSLSVNANGKYQRLAYSDVIDKTKTFTNIKYVAFDDQFFLTAIIPHYAESIDQAELSVREGLEKKRTASIALKLKPFVLVKGEEKVLSHEFFMGPKQVNLLASFAVPLDENVDFGWFGVLSRPMLWLLVQIHGFVNNYGLAIIIITLIIKLLTYPLTQKSFTSQQEMKKLQPKIKELQQKFGNDRTMLGQKQMELYRTHGINPLAGCLPLLIQLPIWFAFFQMLRNSVELFDQPFYGWLHDLTRPDPYYVLPILMGASMLIQQAFTPPPAEQPQMKYVMWAMPIFLTFIMLNMPSGLSLYILTNNLLTIIQQLIINRQSKRIAA